MQHFLTKKSLKNFLKFFLNGVFSYWFFVLYIRAMITFHVCISCVAVFYTTPASKKKPKNFFKIFLIWLFYFALFAIIC